jgi:hypothetical protein
MPGSPGPFRGSVTPPSIHLHERAKAVHLCVPARPTGGCIAWERDAATSSRCGLLDGKCDRLGELAAAAIRDGQSRAVGSRLTILMLPGQHKALATGIFGDGHRCGRAVAPIDGGRIIGNLPVRIGISEAGFQNRKQFR